MVAITATSSATPLLQVAVLRSRLEQAQREAAQSEAEANSLQSQADEAQRQANEQQGVVRDLGNQTRQAQATTSATQVADTALPTQGQNLLAQTSTYMKASSSSEVPAQTQDFLIRLYTATSGKFAASGNALKSDANAPVVLNAQGQATGRILNLRA